MAVVAGFRSLGVLDAAGAWLVARPDAARGCRRVGRACVLRQHGGDQRRRAHHVRAAGFWWFASRGHGGCMCLVATLMTIAANLGSMFTPWATRKTCTCSRPRAWVWGVSAAHGAVYRCVRCDAGARVCAVLSRWGSVRCVRGWICAIGWFLRPMTPPIIWRCEFRLRAGRPRKVPRLILCPPAQRTGFRRRPRRSNPLPRMFFRSLA